MATHDPQATVVVFTTLADPATARDFVRRAVEARVVACGTILPATSVYRWEGQVTQDDEALVVLKTRQACWSALVAFVESSHPYDVPELLALPVSAGLPAYLDWVRAETVEEEAAG